MAGADGGECHDHAAAETASFGKVAPDGRRGVSYRAFGSGRAPQAEREGGCYEGAYGETERHIGMAARQRGL